jgi:O-phospho-L-seryl-tRNASec:L-selenocysteinyl-tRNA synthase
MKLCLFLGRASGTPSLDVLITLLELGTSGYKRLLDLRKNVFKELKDKLSLLASKYEERVLETPSNNISLGT